MQRMMQTELPLWKQIKILPTEMEKKDILPIEKLIIHENMFSGLATRSVDIITEMPVAENSIHYQAGINRNYCYRRVLKKWDI
jgi:hypothetical protein